MSILNIENLSFSFGDKTILNNVNLKLLKGEHVGLIGVNGAGKTTLFNIICENLIQDEGKITKSSNCKIGYLKQVNDFDENITILEILRSAFQDLFILEKKIFSLSNDLSIGNVSDYTKALKKLSNLQDALDASDF